MLVSENPSHPKKSPVFGSPGKLRGRAHGENKPSVFEPRMLYNTASVVAQYFVIIACPFPQDCDGRDSETVKGMNLGNRQGNSKKGVEV